MDRRAKLVVAGLLALAGSAQAYVTPSPPPGFGGSAGAWTYNPPSAAGQLGGIMRGAGPVIPGAGQTSAAYRLGTGAARALAKGVIGGGVAGAAIAGAAWLLEHCFEKQGANWVQTCGGTPPPQSTGYTYNAAFTGAPMGRYSKAQACEDARAWRQANPPLGAGSTYAVTGITTSSNTAGVCQILGTRTADNFQLSYNVNWAGTSSASCPVGWYITDAGCVQTLPPTIVTPQQVEDDMATKPLPQTLPPGIQYPLGPNPTIWNPTITDPATGQPLRVPQGNPVPIPGSDPAAYRQPVTRWTHSPTNAEPWRMDPTGEDVIGNTPQGIQEPQPVTSGSPTGTERQDPPDLCETNPDIVACQKLGELEATPVPNENRSLAITPETGFGASTSACPPPKTATVMGVQLSLPFTMLCDFADGIRPLLLAFAWLSAALTFMGLSRKD